MENKSLILFQLNKLHALFHLIWHLYVQETSVLPEWEFNLTINIRRQLPGVIIIQGNLSLHRHILIDIRPSVRRRFVLLVVFVVCRGICACSRGVAARLFLEEFFSYASVINLEEYDQVIVLLDLLYTKVITLLLY